MRKSFEIHRFLEASITPSTGLAGLLLLPPVTEASAVQAPWLGSPQVLLYNTCSRQELLPLTAWQVPQSTLRCGPFEVSWEPQRLWGFHTSLPSPCQFLRMLTLALISGRHGLSTVGHSQRSQSVDGQRDREIAQLPSSRLYTHMIYSHT